MNVVLRARLALRSVRLYHAEAHAAPAKTGAISVETPEMKILIEKAKAPWGQMSVEEKKSRSLSLLCWN